MRNLLLVLAAVGGLLAGGVGAFGLLSAPTVTPVEPEATTASPSPDVAKARDEVPATSTPKVDQRLLLVWTPGSVPEGLADEIDALPGVEATALVAGDAVGLVASFDATGQPVDVLDPGWIIPLDAFAIDPQSYAAMLPKGAQSTVARLQRGEALLGETSATLRGIGAGSRVRLVGEEEFTVVDVVDDTLVGAAELVIHRSDGERAGIGTGRFILVSHRGDRAEMEAAIRDLVPRDIPVRIRGPGETPFLRHGDAVLPQSLVKSQFGEFAYRPSPDGTRDFTQDPAWVRDHIVAVDVPILGAVRCHRGIVDQLAGALRELETRGLAHSVDPDQYEGCWAPRLIAPNAGVSRHAWGITVDVNAERNPTGVGSGQHPDLVEVMAQWGFTWGGFWLIPDPMHFEYVRPPQN